MVYPAKDALWKSEGKSGVGVLIQSQPVKTY
jgi:hypothetical protein